MVLLSGSARADISVQERNAPVSLEPNGQAARFADQLIEGLPEGFTGVLDLRSPTPFIALTLRSLLNERDEFLMTTFPVANPDTPAPSPMVFPQVADGEGIIPNSS